MPPIVITGLVCLVIGVIAGAVFAGELYHATKIVQEWTLALLVLAGVGAIGWLVLHFALHAV